MKWQKGGKIKKRERKVRSEVRRRFCHPFINHSFLGRPHQVDSLQSSDLKFILDLSEPIDIYSEWIDASEAVNKEERGGGGDHNRSEEDDDNEPSQRYVASDVDEDDE